MHYSARRMQYKRGSILIIFLWALVLLTLFAMSVSYRTRMTTKIEGFEVRQFKRSYQFLSAVNLARFYIEADQDPLVDSPLDQWYGIASGFADVDFMDSFEIEIADEESKININKADERFLKQFFVVLNEKGVRLETDPADLAASIVLWRSGRRQIAGGSTSLGFEHKKAPFESVEELGLVQYISNADLQVLSSFITVYGSPEKQMRLNLNTVHPYILEALILSLPAGSFSKQELLNKIEAHRKADAAASESGLQQVFTAGDLAPNAFMAKLGLTGSPTMLRFVNQFLNLVKVDSEFFSVQARQFTSEETAYVMKAVLGPRIYQRFRDAAKSSSAQAINQAATSPLEILSWNEGFLV